MFETFNYNTMSYTNDFASGSVSTLRPKQSKGMQPLEILWGISSCNVSTIFLGLGRCMTSQVVAMTSKPLFPLNHAEDPFWKICMNDKTFKEQDNYIGFRGAALPLSKKYLGPLA